MTSKLVSPSRLQVLPGALLAMLAACVTLAGCDVFKSSDERIRNADRLLDEGQYNEALVELRNALDDDPKNARALLSLARTSLQLGRFDAAGNAVEAASAAGAPAVEVDTQRMKIMFARGEYDKLLTALDDPKLSIPADQRDDLRARALAAANRCEAALPLARELLARDAGRGTARVVLAECLARRGNTTGALEELEAATAANERDAQAWIALGRLRQLAGDRQGAEAAWRKAAQHAGGQLTVLQQAMMYSALGDMQVERSDLEGLRATRAALLAVAAGSLSAEYLGAQVSLLEGKPEAAVAALQKMVGSDLKLGAARLLLTSALVMQGNLEQARQQLNLLNASAATKIANLKHASELLATLDPAKVDKEEYWSQVAAINAALGQTAMARAALERALSLATDPKNATVALARLDMRVGEANNALRPLSALANRHPGDVAVGLALADAQSLLGRYAEAETVLENLRAKAPNKVLATALHEARKRGGLPNQNAPLEQWLADNPEDAAIRMIYAESLRTAGDPASAAKQLEIVLVQQPKNALALNNLAWVYYLTGDSRAVVTAKRALELAPKFASISDTYGWLLVESGQVAEGLTVLKEADAAAGAVQPEVRFHYAVALARSGDRQQAKVLFEDLLANAGTFPSRAEAVALLNNMEKT